MSEQQFEKVLTANDTGRSGGHQAGIHVPKGQRDLLAFLPPLDPAQKNPSVWLSAEDEDGGMWQFRYIHYNNRLHDEGGTRDEFRITHMTSYFRASGAEPGDILVIRGEPGKGQMRLQVRKDQGGIPVANRIRLRGWRRVH